MRKTGLEIIRELRAAQAHPPALTDKIHVCGTIRARKVPFETREEWQKWWLGEFKYIDNQLVMIRPPRMSEREKERYTAAESRNILVSGGISQLLAYLGQNGGSAVGFAQYFAIGNIAINTVATNDPNVSGEYFRAVPSSANVSGVQIDISTFTSGSSANGTITNAGLWGVNATATIGSGTLMTHSLFSYTKATGSVTFDYLLEYV